MALFLLNRSILVKHEPLRPVAVILILMGKYGQQNFPYLFIFMRGKEVLHRPLAYIPCTPGCSAILLQSVRHGIVNQHIVRVPPGQSIYFEQLCLLPVLFFQLKAVHDACQEITVTASLRFKSGYRRSAGLSVQHSLEGKRPFAACIQYKYGQ
ncbi:hypothetical protein D3C80_1463570 [compost metagenome]